MSLARPPEKRSSSVSPSTLTQFLIDVTRGHLKDAFSAAPEKVLATSPLDILTRDAVLGQDIAALWLASAHPMALMYFARASGWANDRYYRCIADAQIRRADSGEAAPTARPAPSRTHRSSAPHDP